MDSSQIGTLIFGLIILAGLGIGFLVCREIVTWYFKLNELGRKLDTTNKTLADIRHVLAQPRQIP